MTKKLFLALTLLCLAAGTALAAENPEVNGAWGLTFGDSWESAHGIMTSQNGASLICEFAPDEGRREAVYKVNFFGREGVMRLSFAGHGLYLEQFVFTRSDLLEKNDSELTDAEKSEKMRIEVRGGNFRQLMRMLREKYGVPTQTYKDGAKVRGSFWIVGDQTVTIHESRSSTKHDTVLTYEDVSRRK